MKQSVTAIFDIGKTNKKFFLFDENYQEVYREYSKFDEIEDEDGYPTENLVALQQWLKTLFDRILHAEDFHIEAINFSSYGASLVHLDENGEVLTPLYNYTKPIPKEITQQFFDDYGPVDAFCSATGSMNDGMLNSGMQLYWLKHTQPSVFERIKFSLHLPQYLSYIFTGIPLSEYTSIGCHTALWDYQAKDYHSWVYEEGIHHKLPPIVSTETSINMNYLGKRMKIGVGIHDSSSALIPYLRSIKKPFVLVSTGTWSISLNPFESEPLTSADLQNNCINYLRINGKAVKASRLFLGKEHEFQVQQLNAQFKVQPGTHKKLSFDLEMYQRLRAADQSVFHWKHLPNKSSKALKEAEFGSFEEAYHQLVMELTQLQVASIKAAQGTTPIKRIYVDGGFSNNEIYISLLSHHLREMKLRTTNASLGSALGAALCIKDDTLNSKFLKENYALRKHKPFILA
ncbi:FGGY-family carbohydrate kinase [Croceiramulus getboli]|nr:FGGY family carbohydrate kinase [Flavobacteriaceae bacterium YJPT1-3]